jgi:hypothetical protein
MLTPEGRALVTEISNKLDDLLAKRDEAVINGDLDGLYGVEAEITDAAAQRQEIIRSLGADTDEWSGAV